MRPLEASAEKLLLPGEALPGYWQAEQAGTHAIRLALRPKARLLVGLGMMYPALMSGAAVYGLAFVAPQRHPEHRLASLLFAACFGLCVLFFGSLAIRNITGRHEWYIEPNAITFGKALPLFPRPRRVVGARLQLVETLMAPYTLFVVEGRPRRRVMVHHSLEEALGFGALLQRYTGWAFDAGRDGPQEQPPSEE